MTTTTRLEALLAGVSRGIDLTTTQLVVHDLLVGATFAGFTGTIAGTSTAVTLTASNVGSGGNSISLTFSGSNSINAAIATWNTGNPSNTVYLASGDGTQVPTVGSQGLSGGLAGTDLTQAILSNLVTYGQTAMTSLTGDGTASGPGAAAFTLSTVNADVGPFGGSTAIPVITVNAKGLVTAASTSPVVAPAGTLTGTTLASNVVTSSLTAVGTIGTGVWQGTPVAIAFGGTGQTSAVAAFDALSPLTTTGDLLYYNGTHNARLAATTNTFVLTLVAGVPTWTAPATTGANTALSNLSAVAINASLVPGVDNSIDLGTAAHSWANAYVHMLLDGSGGVSVDAYNRLLEDAGGNTSVDYGNRALKDSAAATQMSWSTAGVEFNQLTATTVPYLNSSKVLTSSAVTPTQLGYLSGATGTTGTGNLVYSASPTFTGTLVAAAASLSGALNMNSNLINNLAPGVSGTDAINLNQLQNAMAGVQWRPEADLFDNVDTTKPATTATLIDGTTVTDGMRVLFTNLSSGNNEVYTASVVSTAITWTAALDNDRVSAAPVTGDSILILSGTTYAESAWNYNGTTWVQFNGANQVQPGSALSKTGNTLNVKYDGSTIGLNGSNQLYVPTGGITATQLAAGSVTTAALGTITDGSTLDQSGAGSTLEVKAAGITATQLAAQAVTSAKLATSAFDQKTITGGNGSTVAVQYAPAVETTATYGGAATLAANTTYAFRWGIPANSETVNKLYLADWTTGSFDLFWVVGLYNSGTTTATNATITVVTMGSLTLGSSDANFGSSDQGKPVWLGAAGAYTPNSTFSPVSGSANGKLGIAQSANTIWVDFQMMGVT